MKRTLNGIAGKYSAVCRSIHGAVSRHSLGILFAIGGILLVAGSIDTSMAVVDDISGNMNQERVINLNEGILAGIVEGAFGALVMIVAGLIAIISAALGAYRAALAALVVAVGAFVLRMFVTMFFGEDLVAGGAGGA